MLLCHFYDIKRSVAEKRIIFFILLFFAEPTQHILSAELLRTFFISVVDPNLKNSFPDPRFCSLESRSKTLATRIRILP